MVGSDPRFVEFCPWPGSSSGSARNRERIPTIFEWASELYERCSIDHHQSERVPHQVITAADARVLEKLVGSATFARGNDYARTGAVKKQTWSPGGTHVVGEIQGGTRRPYVATVTLTRSRSKELSAFEASCTCLVGVNCKHAVALVLAKESAEVSSQIPRLTLVRDHTARIPPSQSDGPIDWKLPLPLPLEADG